MTTLDDCNRTAAIRLLKLRFNISADGDNALELLDRYSLAWVRAQEEDSLGKH